MNLSTPEVRARLADRSSSPCTCWMPDSSQRERRSRRPRLPKTHWRWRYAWFGLELRRLSGC